MKVHPHPEPDEPVTYRNSMLWRRFLVFALGFSFLACLLALWATGTVFGDPAQFLPFTLMLFIQNNRLVILIFPLLSLLACYLLLRHVTSDIMACPDRYLDERQKMVRDRAHHHAYKIVNFVCLLIVLCLSLNAILFPVPAKGIVSKRVVAFNVNAAGAKSKQAVSIYKAAQGKQVVSVYKGALPGTSAVVDPQAMKQKMAQAAKALDTSDQYGYAPAPPPWIMVMPGDMTVVKSPNGLIMAKGPVMSNSMYDPVAWPNDPVSISIFYSVLLLSLFLLVKVLPMSVVAWKERA
jgi:hypothetical protein